MILRYSPESKEVIRSLPPEIKQGMRLLLDGLRETPYSGKPLQRELTGFYSLRYKRYRIIYKPPSDDKEVRVYSIGPRKEIYEKFTKLLAERH
ncbi:MAG: type II toxin-antitoxin system RelE/ParE family toxin [Deltaproteobacteria bacterium]|nr:type II toxin-antitoxin system RelE/ParE family toxin [Deltaproteobacteria bacterium]